LAKPLHLNHLVRRPLERGLSRLLLPAGQSESVFLSPAGEAALTAPDSVSWQVFKNPVTVFIGGVAAVLLELAEPRVRSGVWDHTTFRRQPLDRMRRTGFAAMITVYGPRREAETMTAAVSRLHARVQGETPDGHRYSAADPALLTWVHATASFGFLEAYCAFVQPVLPGRKDEFYREGQLAARLFGAVSAPGSQRELDELLEQMLPQLERSPVVFEFLAIARAMPVLPAPLRWLQAWLIRAAVQLLPGRVRERLGLGPEWDLLPWQRRLVCRLSAAADRVVLRTHPAVLACRRLALPDDHLFVNPP
jgi:uncharacterized protein (DUF2236 family)